MAMVMWFISRRTCGSWLSLRPKVGGRLYADLHSLSEPSDLTQWLCHNDCTINVALGVVITRYFWTGKGPEALQTVFLLLFLLLLSSYF